MFSKACEYGIRASIFIAEQSAFSNKVGLKEVAHAINSPEAYTSKILQQLTRSNIIHSEKGPNGGYFIHNAELDTINLSAIVSAIDGDAIYKGCGLGFNNCDATKPCSIHHKFVKIRNELKHMLESTSLLTLSEDINEGLAFLKR